jgi:membrane fusion protein (multidrug efflux system)
MTDATPSSPARKRLLLLATGLAAVAAIAYGTWWTIDGRRYESTDDAYVQGNLVQITPQVAGTVVSIGADDTDRVAVGQPLVRLDAADADVALEQATATLAQTVRQVRTLFASNDELEADIRAREADTRSVRAALARAQSDFDRRRKLGSAGGITGEELQHAEATFTSARAALAAAEASEAAARAKLATNAALTGGTDVAGHPNVRLAAARVRDAYLQHARTTLPAPVAGYVAQRSVQVGQRVAPGTPLMSVVPLDEVWVDANFKEVQIGHMRIGQPVTLTADMYGSKTVYQGTVAGLGVGTGSAFALLPAQNASGNWIKVVQRLPVRIALDPAQLASHPLRIGLSMMVKVDISGGDGPQLATDARTTPAYTTAAFDHTHEEADALIAQTIDANLGVHTAMAKGPSPH